MRLSHNNKISRGFTIVELLIVIVVIGILAAITIVAYNGIQGRAQAAAVSSALEQTAKKLAIYAVDNTTYPVDLATIGVNNTSGTSYQYSINNSVSPQTYCVTAINGTAIYRISSTSTTPSNGVCDGHLVGGVAAITNLETNPSFETDIVGWDNYSNAGTMLDFSRSTVWSNTGSGSIHAKYTIATAGYSLGIRGTAIPCVPGEVFTASAYIDIVSASSVRLRMDDAAYGVTPVYGPISYATGVQRVTVTGTIPAGVTSIRPLLMVLSSTNNETVEAYMDAVLVQKASSVSNYGDGSSTNWVWNGAPNNSTSTGP